MVELVLDETGRVRVDGLHGALFRQAGALSPPGQLGRGHFHTKKSTAQLMMALSPVCNARHTLLLPPPRRPGVVVLLRRAAVRPH